MSRLDHADNTKPRRRGFFGVRFMRRTSIGVKLWATTAILALPVIGLAVFYVHSLSSTLWFTSTEQRGYTLFQPLDRLSWQLEQREEIEVLALTKQGESLARITILDDAIDSELAKFDLLDARYGNEATHVQLKDLRSQWVRLKGGSPASAEGIMAAHEHVLDTVSGLVSQIGSDWELTLDPELAAYNSIDLTLTKIPDARRFLSQARAHMAAMYVGEEYSAVEGRRVASLVPLLSDRIAAAREEIKTAAAAAADRPELVAWLDELGKNWDVGIDSWTDDVLSGLMTGHPPAASIEVWLTGSEKYPAVVNSAQNAALSAAGAALDIRYYSQARSAIIALTGSAIALVLGVVLTWALALRTAGAVRRLLQIAERITDGHHDSSIDDTGTDEISRLFAAMGKMQRTLASQKDEISRQQQSLATQIEGERAQGIENSRIRSALDNVSGCVMVADADSKIIYTNKAIDELLRRAQADIRTQVPNFSADAVIGASMDIFHENPEQNRRVFAGLTEAHSTQIVLGGKTFRLTVNPVLAARSERIGTVTEWIDRTDEVRTENETNDMLTAVLGGNLGQRIDLEGKSGFFEVLGRGMNRLAANMQELIGRVKVSSREVHTAAQEISAGNANLSARTEQQSASLEETASSMEQITATVKQNSDNAHQASQLANAAREQAQDGGAVVDQAIQAMAGINESSKKIANIIGVIDEIAFQTNLLALNAAVEAARAGEHGRGFAVVASEVRNLASRSAAAAKEIKDLIRDSVGKVEGGSQLVTQSGKTLERIVLAVKKVTDVVAEIAAASTEQTLGIQQVNLAITHMDEMTQQNAALVEQATAASQSMTQQAGELTNMLSIYQTDALGTPGRSVRPAVRSTRAA